MEQKKETIRGRSMRKAADENESHVHDQPPPPSPLPGIIDLPLCLSGRGGGGGGGALPRQNPPDFSRLWKRVVMLALEENGHVPCCKEIFCGICSSLSSVLFAVNALWSAQYTSITTAEEPYLIEGYSPFFRWGL